ncbi:MAG: hypothetical protein P1U56_18620 [Saprospiraceae bacterium]|nr:hypothetical protein [Saprospiraceae bacterium]
MSGVAKLHLVFGFLMFLGFLGTGQYMDRTFNHLVDMEDLPRALMRMQHLYILLGSLIHIALGSYLKLSDEKWVRVLQWVGSLLILLSSLMLVYSFFTELPSAHIERPLCRIALYTMLAGVFGHGIPSLLLLIFSKQNP